MKEQQRKPLLVGVSILLVFFVLGGYVVIVILPRVGGITKMPQHQVIREQENICALFVFNSGASEEAMVATAYCRQLQKDLGMYRSFADVWDEDAIISEGIPMTCPMVTVKYEKSYDAKVITFAQDPICFAFEAKNPLKTEVLVKIRYRVNKHGELVELDKTIKSLNAPQKL